MSQGNFASKLIGWYEKHKRDLPWRHTKDPYQIWLSEVILQQTRVQQGLPYFLTFIEQFPTVQDLAEAEEKEVLRLWQGLGYYSRARNMHHAAKQVMTEYKGAFPSSFKELKQLKGVGDYTAAAIASFAFGEKVALVDGNVFRVLARVFGIEDDISTPAAKKKFQAVATELLPDSQIDIYNQAIMEFGALHCKPNNPDCMFCPFSDSCHARKRGLQQKLPVKGKKIKQRKRYFNYLVLEYEGSFLVNKRIKGDIWQGLYEFPCIETDLDVSFERTIQQRNGLSEKIFTNKDVKPLCTFKHILTHQIIYAKFYRFSLTSTREFLLLKKHFQGDEESMDGLIAMPKPVLIDKVIKQHIL